MRLKSAHKPNDIPVSRDGVSESRGDLRDGGHGPGLVRQHDAATPTLQHGCVRCNPSQSVTADHSSLTTYLNEPEWLDAREAATYLRLTLGAVRNMTSNGQLPHYKLGKRVRYLRSELRQRLLAQRKGA